MLDVEHTSVNHMHVCIFFLGQHSVLLEAEVLTLKLLKLPFFFFLNK